MPRKQKESNSSLGHQLIKDKTQKKVNKIVGEGPGGRGFKVHTTVEHRDVTRPQLSSILEQGSLDEFMQLANLSQKKFEAERGQSTLISANEVISGSGVTNHAAFVNNFIDKGIHTFDDIKRGGKYQSLRIPRRPAWGKKMSAQEIAQNENLAFLEWRRDIATQEQNAVNLAITPFEKNIEVWRQLWRVIEKSDVLIQIVDARNPEFFYASDLEKYIEEVGQGKKEFLLLINKSDFLSEDLIKHWNAYFVEKKIKHLFFSALTEQERLDAGEDEFQESESSEDEEQRIDKQMQMIKAEDEIQKTKQETVFSREFIEQDEKDRIENASKLKIKTQLEKDQQRIADEKLTFNTTHLFNRLELLALLKHYAVKFNQNNDRSAQERLMVGTVGYPNVGKSSVINVLCGIKRVGVANRPGKTKHFQTLNLGEDLCLCDCPGLVFPSFANSKAEMTTCGVLHIDTMKEYIAPIQLIMSRVPKEIKLPPSDSDQYTAALFLSLIASSHGWLTGSATPNQAVASRQILRDYTNGKLLYVQLRPDYDEKKHGKIEQTGFNLSMQRQIEADAHAYQQLDEETKTNNSTRADVTQSSITTSLIGLNETDEFDRQFFQAQGKLKLTKDQKRQLKFLMKQGFEVNSVADLQSFLQIQVNNNKNTSNTPQQYGNKVQKPGQRAPAHGVKKVTDYKDLAANHDI